MIIYNVTTQVTWAIHERWKAWLLTQHLNVIFSTGIFSHHQLVRLLGVDDHYGPTYALQLYVNEHCSIDEYKSKHLHAIEQQEKTLWGDEAYSFSTLMEVIN
jgi:hypothetical protein